MANNFTKQDRFMQRVTMRFKSDVVLVDVLALMYEDSCTPASAVDASKLARIVGGLASPMEHIVTFNRAGESKHVLTRAWASIGAEVLDIRSPRAEPYHVGAMS